MTDAQFGILMAVLGTIGTSIVGIIRWAVVRIVKSLDDNTVAHRESAVQMAVMTKSVEFSYHASREVRDFMVEERSGVHEVRIGGDDPTPPLGIQNPGYRKPGTPPIGTAVVKIPLRKKTETEKG